jgi:streptogramin lyase
MISRLVSTRYFPYLAFGANAAGVAAIGTFISVANRGGADLEGILLFGALLNTAMLAILLPANTYLLGLRWRNVATKQYQATATYGLATSPLSFALNQWSISPAPMSAAIGLHGSAAETIGFPLGVLIDIVLFSALGWLLFSISTKWSRFAGLNLAGLCVCSLLLPAVSVNAVYWVPAAAREFQGRWTHAAPFPAFSDNLVVVDDYPTGDNWPMAIAATRSGQIWFARFYAEHLPTIQSGEDGERFIFRISRSGSQQQFLIDNSYSYIAGLAPMADGSVWIINHPSAFDRPNGLKGDRIVHIDRDGRVIGERSMGANNDLIALVGSQDGSLWISQRNPNSIVHLSGNGILHRYRLQYSDELPIDMAFDREGNLWFVSGGFDRTDRLGKIDESGKLATFTMPGPARWPWRITLGADGAMWFTEYHGNKIGRISGYGAISEYAVNSVYGYPSDIASAANGDIWFTTNGEGVLWKIDKSGRVTRYPLPGLGGNVDVQGLCVDRDGTILIGITEDKVGHVLRLKESTR